MILGSGSLANVKANCCPSSQAGVGMFLLSNHSLYIPRSGAQEWNLAFHCGSTSSKSPFSSIKKATRS